MPAPALKSLVEQSGKSMKDAERYWEEAKDNAKEQGFAEGSDRYYQYVMGIVKRRLGLAHADVIQKYARKIKLKSRIKRWSR